MISTTDTILETLKTELISTINGRGNYECNLSSKQVERGIVSWEETDGKRPYVWFILTEESLDELMGTSAHGELTVELHGYVDPAGSNANLHEVLKDIKYFLYNDFSYDALIDSVLIHEGGNYKDLNMSGFLVSFRIPYQYTTTTL